MPASPTPAKAVSSLLSSAEESQRARYRARRKRGGIRRTSRSSPPSPAPQTRAASGSSTLLDQPPPCELNPQSPARRNTTTTQSRDRARSIAYSPRSIHARPATSQLSQPPPSSPASPSPAPRSPKPPLAIRVTCFPLQCALAPAPKAHPLRQAPQPPQTTLAHPRSSAPSAQPLLSNQTRRLPPGNVLSRECVPVWVSARKSRKNAPAREPIRPHRSPLPPPSIPKQSPPPRRRSIPRSTAPNSTDCSSSRSANCPSHTPSNIPAYSYFPK